jgi:hypothetical protein
MTVASATPGADRVVKALSSGLIDPNWLDLSAIKTDDFFLVDPIDVTKRLNFSAAAAATGITTTISTGAQTVNRTLTVPVLSANDTIATLGLANAFAINQNITRALVTDATWQSFVTGDTQPRYKVSADGKIEWGAGGAAPVDTNLYRNAVNTLRTDGSFVVVADPGGSQVLRGTGGYRFTGDSIITSATAATAPGTAALVVTGGIGATSIFLGGNLITDTSTGMKIGTGTTQKLGFWNATPVVRPSAFTQTFATAARTVNAYTSDPESSAYTGIDNAQAGTVYAKLTDLNSLRTAYETLRAMAENMQQVVNALIDDHQSIGLCG